MNRFFGILATERKAVEHFVLIMDGAGWHNSKSLKLTDGITVVLLFRPTARNAIRRNIGIVCEATI